jgi:hypothetical protein
MTEFYVPVLTARLADLARAATERNSGT